MMDSVEFSKCQMQTISFATSSHGMKRKEQFTVYLRFFREERTRRNRVYVCICNVGVAEDHTNQPSTRN